MPQTRPDSRRVLLGFAAVVALPLLIVIDSGIGIARGWRITYGQEKVILTVMAMWLAVAVFGVMMPRGRVLLSRRWPHFLTLLLACIFCVTALEVAARYMPAEEAPFHLRQPSRQWIFRPDPKILPGLSPESRYTTNAQGVRGPAMPPRNQAARILCLGGSTTECLYLDDEKTWTHLLMRELNAPPSPSAVWSGSAGASGMSSEAHLAFVKSSALMSEIDTLLILVGVNDLAKSLEMKKNGAPAGEVQRPELIGRPLWRRSRALIEAGVLLRRIKQRYTHGSIVYEDIGGESYTPRRTRRQQARQVDDIAGLVGEGSPLSQYPERIRGIIAACRAKNVTPIFITQPVLWADGLPEDAQRLLWFGWREDGTYLTMHALRSLMDQYNAVLRETCAAEGVACIDLSSMNGRPEWFYDDCHFTEAGAREVTRLIVEPWPNTTQPR